MEERMGTCTMMNCLRPICGRALICDQHRAERVAGCARNRSLPSYKPKNPDCAHGMHAGYEAYGQLVPGFSEQMVHKACAECHYCGEVHHWEPVAA